MGLIKGLNVQWTIRPRGNVNKWMMGINWSGNNVSTCQWVNEIGI